MGKVVIRGYGDLSFPTYPTYKETVDEDKAIETIEEHLKTQTYCRREVYDFDIRTEVYDFDIRTEDDETYLYSYRDGKIYK